MQEREYTHTWEGVNWMSLDSFLQQELDKRGWSQQDLERESGVPDSTISRIRHGGVREPPASKLYKIAAALGIPFWRIMAAAGYTSDVPGAPDAEAKRRADILGSDPELADAFDEIQKYNDDDRRAFLDYVEFKRSQRDRRRSRRNAPPHPPEDPQDQE